MNTKAKSTKAASELEVGDLFRDAHRMMVVRRVEHHGPIEWNHGKHLLSVYAVPLGDEEEVVLWEDQEVKVP